VALGGGNIAGDRWSLQLSIPAEGVDKLGQVNPAKTLPVDAFGARHRALFRPGTKTWNSSRKDDRGLPLNRERMRNALRRQSAVRLLQLMMVASVVLPTVLFVFASWVSWRHEHELADDRIDRSLDIVHEHSLKVFQTGERAIAEVEEVIRGMSDEAILADRQRLSDRLKQIVDATPQFQAIVVIDRNGRALASNALRMLASDVSASDRAYFRAHVAGADGTVVSEALAPRWGAFSNHFFTLSHRRRSLDGLFNGVVRSTGSSGAPATASSRAFRSMWWRRSTAPRSGPSGLRPCRAI
jgi:hypothetical protein